MRSRFLFLTLALLGLPSLARGAAPPRPRPPEALRMLTAILAGQPIGPGRGWFRPSETAYDWTWLASRFDADGDGMITSEEFRGPEEFFARLDRNEDGKLTRVDFQRAQRERKPAPKGAGKPPDRSKGGAGPSRWTLLRGLFTGEIGSLFEGPALGETAPAFTLRTHDGQRTISLADFRNKKPVVLIFGSFT